jgi:hypothetical protein
MFIVKYFILYYSEAGKLQLKRKSIIKKGAPKCNFKPN